MHLLFRNHIPLEKDEALHLHKLEFPSPKDALCKVWLKFLAKWFFLRTDWRWGTGDQNSWLKLSAQMSYLPPKPGSKGVYRKWKSILYLHCHKHSIRNCHPYSYSKCSCLDMWFSRRGTVQSYPSWQWWLLGSYSVQASSQTSPMLFRPPANTSLRTPHI